MTIITIINIIIIIGDTIKSFEATIAIIKKLYPDDWVRKVPGTYAQIKKRLEEFMIPYHTMHICEDSCYVFSDNREMNCPVCGKYRYKGTT
jgi:hypothetical protein